MAKHTINYSCGHGAFVSNVVGKMEDRARKVRWFEENSLCPACYKAAQQAEREAQDAALPLQAVLTLDGTSMVVTCSGGLRLKQAALAELGFAWASEGFAMVLANPVQTVDEGKSWAREVHSKLAELGYKCTQQVTREDMAKLTALLSNPPQPVAVPPSWYGALLAKHPEARWNGTIYGKLGDRSIYIGGIKYPITETQFSELRAYCDSIA
jgi:hypothetical protein